MCRILTLAAFILMATFCRQSTSTETQPARPPTEAEIKEYVEKAGADEAATKNAKKKKTTKKYTKSDVFGNWWTPHYAVRKIQFNADGVFVFDDGGGNIFKGNYEFDGNLVHITFKNKLDNWLKISGGGEEGSFVLSGGGETFVKEWDESH